MPGQQRRAHARRRPAAHHRARAAQRLGRGGRGARRRHGPHPRDGLEARASTPTRCRGTSRPRREQRLLTDRYHPLHDKTLGRDLLPGLDLQGGLGDLGARGSARHARRASTKCHGSFEIGAPPLQLHEDARRGQPLRRHRAELQRLLLRAGRAPRHDGPAGQVRRRPGPRRAHGPRPQRRGRRLPAHGGVVPRAEAPEPQGRGLPDRAGAQRRHRPGLDARDAAADGALYAAIANGGKLWLPQIVDRVEAPDGQVLEEFAAARAPRDLPVSPETPGVRAPGARGRRQRAARARPSRSARRRSGGRGQDGHGAGARAPHRGEPAATRQGDHAWFVGFAPAGRPRIALAVLVEHGGHGGEVAAPMAMEIVDNYFETVAPADGRRRTSGCRAAHNTHLRRRRRGRRARRAGGRPRRSPPRPGGRPAEGRHDGLGARSPGASCASGSTGR